MRILVAGASGYIGGRLAAFLADEGHQVIALCNSNIPTEPTWVNKMEEVICVDVSSHAAVEELSSYELDAIINLVSLDHHQSNGNANLVSSVNVEPTWSFLQVFAEKKLKKYIYLSTIHVYGNKLVGKITEDHQANPANQYGLTHLLSEQICHYFTKVKGIDSYVIRFSNGFGAPRFAGNKCWDLVINNLCLNAWQKQQLILKSDGSPLRDFINIADLLNGVKHLLQLEAKESNNGAEVFNFSSAQTITMLDAAFAVKRVYEEKYNKKATIFVNENQLVEEYKGSVTNPSYTIDNEKFKKLLGGDALLNLEYGINEIFDFLEQTST